MVAAMNNSGEDDIVAEVKAFFQEREGGESRIRESFVEDLNFAFVPGAQWQQSVKNKRKGRLCMSYNRTVGAINQLVGDQRKMKVSGQVRPETPDAAAGTAELFGGLIRDIEAASGAQTIYGEAFKYAVAGSWGVWRIVSEYEHEESFDQVLRLQRVANPLTVYFDELADPFGRGGMQVVVADRISRTAYEAMYGDRDGIDMSMPHDENGWADQNQIRVAEYYKKTSSRETIALLSDGRVVPAGQSLRDELERMRDAGLETPEVLRERVVDRWRVSWWKMDGMQTLEGPIEYQYKHIPVIRVPGRHINIEGEQFLESLHRHGHDAARTYNYDRSSMTETVALTPRAPYIGTAKMFAGYEGEWGRSNFSNSPFLRFNADPDMPGVVPERKGGPEVPAAFIALAAHDAEDIRQTIGYTNPAVEQQTRAGDAESGAALRTRLSANDSGSYEFLDNFEKAIQYTWTVLIDMIPVHYDTQRTVRLLGLDGREQFADLDPDTLRQGRFDVTATLGPAYATQRMEALDTLLQAAQAMPEIAEEAPDIIVRNLDIQGAAEIEQRIRRRLIQQGKVQPTEDELAAGIQPPQPDPTQQALTERLMAQTARDKASAVKTQIEAAVSMAEAEAAPRKEQLELAQMVQDMAKGQAEIKLMMKELMAPRETKQ